MAALLLAFVLVFTGQSMALARFMAAPTGEMVLCTGTGPIAILVDEEGQPVGKPHICPDCALSFFAAVSDVPDAPVRPLAVSDVVYDCAEKRASSSGAVRAVARGPPQGA